MKIKIIDLLNKIANGEDVPEKIKYEGQEYKLQMSNDYLPYNGSFYLFENIFKANEISCILNNKVEIIKEDKPIESENEIENLEELGIKIGQMYKELIKGIIKGFEEEKNQ